MSLIERIKETESQAETIKADAQKEVEAMLIKVKQENERTIQEMYNELDIEIQTLKQETLEKIAMLESNRQEECQLLCSKYETLSKNHLDETVDFIIKKVITS